MRLLNTMTGTTQLMLQHVLPFQQETFQNTVLLSSTSDPLSSRFFSDSILLDDNMGELDLVDTRRYSVAGANGKSEVIEDLPKSISGTYTEDYNIVYIDTVIRKKLKQEKQGHLQTLRNKYKQLEIASMKPQTFLVRESTLESMSKIKLEIEQIENGFKLEVYDRRTSEIINNYKKCNTHTKTVLFEIDETEKYCEMNSDTRDRISLIERYLDIASEYIKIDIIRVNNKPADICSGCGSSLSQIAPNEDGTIRCINDECRTEHNVIIITKLSKDGSRINTNNNTDDESIENFLRCFVNYNGLQTDKPDDSLYTELDAYFSQHDRPIGAKIREMPLNEKGRRGDTDHEMMWFALSQINRSEYYKDVNLIGHIYWGWLLPDTMQYKERIISDYHKTQRVFYAIPPNERGRGSSLGTQYRLWRHLQLVGHDCSMDEFKIAENPESMRIHNRLWRLMCEGADDPNIYYIP
jgi:hypothetical protein